jgi:hypothetical protein
MQRLARSLVSLLLLFALFPQSAFACGPFSMEAVFVFTVHPAYPLENYARGELGIIQPSYARSYLYAAYRYLNNQPFTSLEQKALTQLWKERLGQTNDTWESGETWIKSWLDARQKLPGLPEPPKIDVFRHREKPNEYDSFLNCPKDAFETAVSTLNARLRSYGADTSSVRTWVEAQDQVFSNCGEGQNIPPMLSTNADQVARADRNYQIAAASFYATKFDDAQQGFEAIATDLSSPWRPLASYLLARTFVRKASLGAEQDKTTSLSKAEDQLHKIGADKNLTSVHSAASRLLDLVRLRLHPSERMHELAHKLVDKNTNDHLKQDLWDYTTLLDGVLETEGQKLSAAQEQDLETDDLTDWLSTLQGNSPEDFNHALSRWQKDHSNAWLVCVLSKVNGKNAKAADFISEALKVKSGTSAFPSARYHAIRLMIESGKPIDARTLLDQTLKDNRAQFDASSLNLLLNERMMLAPNLADFLSHLPLIPAALSWNDDGREIPTEPSEVSDEAKALIGKPLYDFDAARVLNEQMPLSVLKEAVKDPSLPNHLRQDLTQAAWIRAVLLADYKTADELVPTLRSLIPTLSTALGDFSISQGDDKNFSGLYAWLKLPGMEPVVDAGIGRDMPLNQQDSYRDNWWCGATFGPPTEPVAKDEEESASFTKSSISSPLFLNEAQRQAGTKEWLKLKSLGAMPNYLSKQVIQWATKNPADKRVPEALHLAVNATRHGCTDKETGRWSKAAFDLLHRKYPNTTWAKKTKYWFKE